jgi:hypothetical protein
VRSVSGGSQTTRVLRCLYLQRQSWLRAASACMLEVLPLWFVLCLCLCL